MALGLSFENHLEELFKKHNIRYSHTPVTENNSKPDFIFPCIELYRNMDYPSEQLTMLGAKTTAKDRWRQVHDEEMLSEYTISRICDILKPDGIYAANIRAPKEGYGSMPLIMAQNILRNHFKTVKLWQVNRDRDPKERQNCILYARNPRG